MKTIQVNEFITLVVSEESANLYKEAEARVAALEREAEWLSTGLPLAVEAARAAGDWDSFSDLYKDLYGFRPWDWEG